MNAKITLSSKELELVTNAEWILTKHAIIQKVYRLFGDHVQLAEPLIMQSGWIPGEVKSIPAKIAKGENYLQLPYVMLDYPRYFSGENVFAIRCFFWWGNFFSVSLQLGGVHFQNNRELILSRFEWLKERQFYLCIAGDPWQHHFGTGNFVELEKCTATYFHEQMEKSVFIKLTKKIPLHEWDHAAAFMYNCYQELLNIPVL